MSVVVSYKMRYWQMVLEPELVLELILFYVQKLLARVPIGTRSPFG